MGKGEREGAGDEGGDVEVGGKNKGDAFFLRAVWRLGWGLGEGELEAGSTVRSACEEETERIE